IALVKNVRGIAREGVRIRSSRQEGIGLRSRPAEYVKSSGRFSLPLAASTNKRATVLRSRPLHRLAPQVAHELIADRIRLLQFRARERKKVVAAEIRLAQLGEILARVLQSVCRSLFAIGAEDRVIQFSLDGLLVRGADAAVLFAEHAEMIRVRHLVQDD